MGIQGGGMQNLQEKFGILREEVWEKNWKIRNYYTLIFRVFKKDNS